MATEIVEQRIELACERRLIDVEFGKQACLDLGTLQTIGAELPESSCSWAQRINLVCSHVNEHDLVAHSAKENVGILIRERTGHPSSLPFCRSRRTVCRWGVHHAAKEPTAVRGDPLARPEEAFRRLYSYVAYRIGPGPDAEDVVSTTVERALRYRESFDAEKGTPTSWLIGIANRVLADAGRARAQETPVADGLDVAVADDFAPTVIASVGLTDALGKLDDRSRELLALRYGADLKATDIATLLGERTNTVEVALHRALARLRVLLESDEQHDPHVLRHTHQYSETEPRRLA